MIYAVISDIHGNYPALKAVVSDAKTKGAEAFLLLGDYIRDTPTPNEVVDTIRNLPNCTAILGNGDICLFGHNHLQFLGKVAGKILLNPGSCGMPADCDTRAPYALMEVVGDKVEIQLCRIEYDVEETIKAILEFNGFTHAQFWGRLRAAMLKTGSDIPMSRFWQHARATGGGMFPMLNETWRKTIASYEFDYNWNREDWRRFGERLDVIHHYNALVDENNDPARDPEPVQEYMDKWDGQAFIDEMKLSADKTVLEIGVGTGRLALKVCGKCKSFVGIDISPKTIERAKENMAAFDNKELVRGDFLVYDFTSRFDVIYSSLTFMHIEDKQSAINKVSGLLKPGGRFVLSISRSQDSVIDFGNRKIKIFPDDVESTRTYIKNAGLLLEKQFDTEFATVFVASKN